MLSCENLSAVRNDREIFAGLGFTIGTGSAVVLRGPNGSGKTTLLKILAGLVQPAQGDVRWYDTPLRHDPISYQRDMLFCGHQLALKPELTVEDNLRFWSQLRHSEEMLESALRYFHLDDKRDLPCGHLSMGWQKRVALARLMACYAELWLLDEPLANLDEEGQILVTNLINIRTSQGGIVVLSSHQALPISAACEIDIRDYRPC